MNSTHNKSFEIAAKNVLSDLHDLIKEDRNMICASISFCSYYALTFQRFYFFLSIWFHHIINEKIIFRNENFRLF